MFLAAAQGLSEFLQKLERVLRLIATARELIHAFRYAHQRQIHEIDARSIVAGRRVEVTFKFMPGAIYTGKVETNLQAIVTDQSRCPVKDPACLGETSGRPCSACAECSGRMCA